jgi:hypothetical protein
MMIDFDPSHWKELWVEKLIFTGLKNVAAKVSSLALQAEELWNSNGLFFEFMFQD